MISSYGKFLNVVKALKEATPEWPYLDAVEDRLLNSLISKWHSDKEVTVAEAATMLAGSSEATAMRRMTALVDKGVIKLEISDIDGRIKFVKPTTLTVNYFTQLGNRLDQAT